MSKIGGIHIGYIYLLTNLVNGKKYVGQTVHKPEFRWSAHIYEMRGLSKRYLTNAIRRYGVENFSAEVIHTCTEALLDAAERYFIQVHSTLRPNGYNLTNGGQSTGKFYTPFVCRKISRAVKERYEDPTQRAKTAEARRRYFSDPANRAAQSAAVKRSYADPLMRERLRKTAQKRWRDHPEITEENRRNQSAAQKLRHASFTKAEKLAYKETCRKAQLKRYADPEQRRLTGEASKLAWQDQERLRKNVEQATARWADPAYKERLKKKFRAHWLQVKKNGGLTAEEKARRSVAQLRRYARERGEIA